MLKQFDSKTLFANESQEYDLKENLADLIQKILLENSISSNKNNDLINLDTLSIDKKLLLVITNILIRSFDKNILSCDVSILTGNRNESEFDNKDQNFDYTSTQSHKQKLIDLNKIVFLYLKVFQNI
jgi:hypothetical protein